MDVVAQMKYFVELKNVNITDIAMVGGKNASTGEMIQNLSRLGVNILGGFATTVGAYKEFLSQGHLDQNIYQTLSSLKINNIKALHKVSEKIRHGIISTPFLPEFEREVAITLKKLGKTAVSIRSSATAEDLPEASFAGQQESFLNVKGLPNVLQAIKFVFASLFTSRAIAYRHHHGFDHKKFAISVGVQPMIRSDKGVSGVMFTLDTESGFNKVVLINASYGLGEAIVQGKVNPDEFLVYKPTLQQGKPAILQRKLGSKAIKMIYTHSKSLRKLIKTTTVTVQQQSHYCIDDYDIHLLAKQACLIEKHYGKPMDIEWAKDGLSGKIYILQSRPETVKSQAQTQFIERYILSKRGKILAIGQSVGQRIGQGRARVVFTPKNMQAIKKDEVLITDMTDPDWEPIMRKAAAIVTNRGGRTCHAAIIARELGIPAVIGCGNVTARIKNNDQVTVSCAEGETGYLYAGKVPYKVNKIDVKTMPKLPLKICMNMGNPDKAFAAQFLPNDGVGLARLEFIISDMIGIHPRAILKVRTLSKKLQKQIYYRTSAYVTPVEFYIEKLREGMAMIAAAFYPKQVIFRFSDFKSNEYANLLGGELYEPHEENPMLGFRGASRYKDEKFRDCFKLECEAFKRVRDKMGLVNAQIMIPFVRTVNELRQVIDLMATFGLERKKNALKIYMMCEIPSNIVLAKEFLRYVDGFSIGSNDLTQLVLGLDRDSSLVAPLFDERNDAIKKLLHQVIKTCRAENKYIGICGQGPSDHPDFAAWLMHEGIQSLSLSPDSVVATWLSLSKEMSRGDALSG